MVLTDHVIATAILLYRSLTLRTLLGVSVYPVGRFTIVVTLFLPFFKYVALHRVMPHFSAKEAKVVTAQTLDGRSLYVLDLID